MSLRIADIERVLRPVVDSDAGGGEARFPGGQVGDREGEQVPGAAR
jgi:hypothetical protein